MKILAQNKKAFHDYSVLETIEAGIVLTGDEVKSAKAGHISLAGSFATLRDGELYLLNAHIAAYEKAFQKGGDERKSRKLLLHRQQIDKLIGEIARKGITIVPLKIYATKKGLLKVELGLCKSKKQADKKQVLKERDIRRETERAIKKF
jgi:SsrA-binding protein